MEARCKASAPEARSKAGPPIGSCASNSNPFRQGVKRSAGAPALPESIERLATTYWQCYGAKMRKHDVENFPKTFTYYNQRLHFMLHEFVKGLVFEPEEYAPILNVLHNGGLKYEKVTAHDQKWLPKRSDGSLMPDDKRVSFEPVVAWTEDRWIFCRRMSGDEICQILFYHMATFIWRQNALNAHQMHDHQVSLLTTVFCA